MFPSVSIECPLDDGRIDGRIPRLVAAQVVILGLGMVFGPSFVAAMIAVALGADFTLRAAGARRYSPLGLVARTVVAGLGGRGELIPLAPKAFSAGIGAVFCATIALTFLFHADEAARILAAVLTLFASLEATIALCVGCHMYSLLQAVRGWWGWKNS